MFSSQSVCRPTTPGLQWTGEDQIVSVREEETDMIRMAVRRSAWGVVLRGAPGCWLVPGVQGGAEWTDQART